MVSDDHPDAREGQAGRPGVAERFPPSQRGFRSGVLAASTPWLVRSDRPSSIVAPNRNITKMEIDGAAGGLTIGSSGSSSIAPPKGKMRRAGVVGHPPPRDKEHHLASRKCRRESTPQTRDWRLISVAHEEGNLNDLRAILGNDVAIGASREGKLPFPGRRLYRRLGFRSI